jgi:basic membrane protein A
LIALALPMIAALAAAGCGGSSNSGAGTTATTATTSTTSSAPLKVGLVTDIGGLNDKSFNFLANKGLQAAKATLGIQADVKESHSNTDYVPNLQAFAQQGYDLVIAVGFLMAQSVGQVAKKYPHTKFAIIDQTVTDKTIGNAKNVEGLLFKEQDAGYLAGYLAGLLQKQGGIKGFNNQSTISSVGGLKIPPVDRYIAGYQAGAKAADPNIKTLNGYSNSFTDQSKCKGLAQTQIAAGSDVVFQVAGGCGLGALDAAGQKNVWGIGVDNDQKAVGPQVLASAVKKVDQAVFLTIKDLQKGIYHGGTDKIYGLAQGGVDLVSIRPVVPASIIAKVAAAKAKIVAGTITPPDTVK